MRITKEKEFKIALLPTRKAYNDNAGSLEDYICFVADDRERNKLMLKANEAAFLPNDWSEMCIVFDSYSYYELINVKELESFSWEVGDGIQLEKGKNKIFATQDAVIYWR